MPRSLPAVRILIADDDDDIRGRIVRVLRHSFGVVELGEAGTVEETLRLATAERWDVILLDLVFPVGRGIAVLKALRAAGDSVPIIIVSSAPAEQLQRPLLAAGANAFVQKERLPEELRKLVRSVLPSHLLPGVAS